MTRRDIPFLTNPVRSGWHLNLVCLPIFSKEVIKWIIAVLANGVVTRSKSRRAVTTSLATPLAVTL